MGFYYFFPIRIRNSKAELPMILQSIDSVKARESDVFNVYINEIDTTYYQTLGEINKAETYDTIQQNMNCN